jgi:hypothetical protein
MDRAARRKGASMLSPVREDASRKCTSWLFQVNGVGLNSGAEVTSEWSLVRIGLLVPFSDAHLLASAHSTCRSSSLSSLFPTRTVTRLGLANARASVNHRDRFTKELRLR